MLDPQSLLQSSSQCAQMYSGYMSVYLNPRSLLGLTIGNGITNLVVPSLTVVSVAPMHGSVASRWGTPS